MSFTVTNYNPYYSTTLYDSSKRWVYYNYTSVGTYDLNLPGNSVIGEIHYMIVGNGGTGGNGTIYGSLIGKSGKVVTGKLPLSSLTAAGYCLSIGISHKESLNCFIYDRSNRMFTTARNGNSYSSIFTEKNTTINFDDTLSNRIILIGGDGGHGAGDTQFKNGASGYGGGGGACGSNNIENIGGNGINGYNGGNSTINQPNTTLYNNGGNGGNGFSFKDGGVGGGGGGGGYGTGNIGKGGIGGTGAVMIYHLRNTTVQ